MVHYVHLKSKCYTVDISGTQHKIMFYDFSGINLAAVPESMMQDNGRNFTELNYLPFSF